MHKVKNRKYLSLSVLLFFSMSLFFAPFSYALELVISGNGSESNSEVKVQVENNVTVAQTNEATVGNSIDESANTGQNSASGNSSDSVNIETGDIISATSINTSLNTSTAEIGCCSSTETNLLITGNGDGSLNTISFNQGKNTDVNINNNADVLNSVNGKANTGENRASNNTGGNVSISTGSIKILNDINNDSVNISSVNVKKGLPGVSAVIKENGSGSVNIIETNLFDDVSIYLNHTANIKNDITWEANTGGNEASGNTGGDVNISTGDVELGVFIKNFVNIGSVDIDCCKDIYDPGIYFAPVIPLPTSFLQFPAFS